MEADAVGSTAVATFDQAPTGAARIGARWIAMRPRIQAEALRATWKLGENCDLGMRCEAVNA